MQNTAQYQEQLQKAVDNLSAFGEHTTTDALETVVAHVLRSHGVKLAYDAVEAEYKRDQDEQQEHPSFEYECARCELNGLITDNILRGLGLNPDSEDFARAVHELACFVDPHLQG